MSEVALVEPAGRTPKKPGWSDADVSYMATFIARAPMEFSSTPVNVRGAHAAEPP